MSDRPKRDVSAKSAVGKCDHCGGHAHHTLDSEHIWKCSEIVTAGEVRELRDAIAESDELDQDGIVDALDNLLPEGSDVE